jgi:hypothetical protein
LVCDIYTFVIVSFDYLPYSAQRNECREWLANAALAATQALYNFDLIKFYHNYLNRIADDQRNGGELSEFSPSSDNGSFQTTTSKYPVIDQKGIHVTTGIVSTARLYPILSDNGHYDLTLELISSTTYLSYGYMFNNPYENATTIWERRNTATEGPRMNSRNQAMYGSIGKWFYSHLASIDLSSNIIIIRPRIWLLNRKNISCRN